MAENSKIEWTHHTFNPWWGCAKVSPACDNCYAERDANRFTPNQELWGADADRRTFGVSHWAEPLKWNRKAAAEGARYRVFTASMADVFDKNAPEGARERLFALIKATPNLDWLMLTKRIGNAAKMLPSDWGDGYPNVWLGISVVSQEEADRDIPKLLQTPARLRWLSMEPLLGTVDIAWALGHRIGIAAGFLQRGSFSPGLENLRPLDWVVAGGESGPNARPMHPDWARTLRDQCEAARAPFLFKQWGEWAPAEGESANFRVTGDCPFSVKEWHSFDDGQQMARIGKKAAGRMLDGKLHDGYPTTRH